MADLDVRQNLNIKLQTETATTATTAAKPSKPIRLVSQSTLESYNDCTKFTTNSNQNNTQTASEKEIDNALRPLFNKYGADWDSIKHDSYKLFGKINHNCANPAEKQITITSENILKLKTYLEELLKTLKENNQEITLANLLAVHDNVVLAKTQNTFSSKDKVTLDSIKKAGLMDELAAIAGCSVKQLQNKSEKELQDVLDIWKNTYDNLSKNGKEFSAKTLRETANDNYLLKKAGVSQEEFDKMIANGEVKSLRTLLGLKKGDAITSKKIEDLLNKQNQEFKTRLEEITDPQQREEFIKASVAKQKQMFTLTLRATDRSDRRAMVHAIKDLFAENRGESIKTLLSSLDEETRIELANSIDDKQLKEILLNPDSIGQYVSRDNSREITAEITSCSAISANQSRHNAMMKDEDLQAIIAKVKAGEELTEDEQRLYNYFVDRQSGEFIGVANHNYSDPQSKEIQDLLGQFNSDAYSLPTYRDVMGAISEYIETHDENLPNNLADVIDEATDGNYSTVVSDIQNGTISELTPPSQTSGYVPASTSNGSSSADLGFTTPNQPVNPSRVEEIKAEILTTPDESNESIPTTKAPQDILAATQNTKTFSTFLKDNGAVTTVTEVFSNITHITNQGIINRAALLYKGLKQMQDDVLMAVNNSGLTALLPLTSESTLKGLEGQTFSNFDATRQVREACEEIEA